MSLKEEDYLKLCSRGDLNLVKEKFKDLNRDHIESVRDKHQASVLHYAARNGHINILDYFINEKNISPFLVSEIGASCLHDAAVKGKLEVIKWLLKNTGLTSSFKDTNGATIIHLASKYDQIDLINWLIDTEGAKCVKQLTFNGATCLHFAASTNSFKSLRILVQTVPSYVNYQMINGVTPIYLAVQENNIIMVKYLIKSGANVNLRAEDGMNCLHVACQNGNLEIVQLLHDEFGVNLNEKDFNSATPLHYASINGNSKLVAFLLSNGAKISIDKFGNSPLHDTAVGGHLECARLLIANNCDVALKDNDDRTCIEIALAYGYDEYVTEIKKFLIKKETIEQVESCSKNSSIPTPLNRSLRKSPTPNKSQITSPIFNSNAVSTSTPSGHNNENKNQGFIKIIRSESDKDKKFEIDQTRVSAIDELDKCIAEFEADAINKKDQNNNLSLTMIMSNNSNNSTSSSSSILMSPDQNNNNNSKTSFIINKNIQMTLPSKSGPPPPPPPIPTNWLSLDSDQKKVLNFKINNKIATVETKKPVELKPVNFIDELENQIKGGSVLKKKNENNLENLFKKLDNKPRDENLEKTLESIKKVTDFRIKDNSKVEMPEWKRQLIERKKLNKLNSLMNQN